MNKTTYMWLDTLGGIDKLVFYVFCGIAGVISVLALAVYVIGCFRRKSVLSSMDEWITLGGLFLTTTVIIRGLDPIWTNDQSRDILCQIYPCLLTLGLTYFVGGMFVKGVGIFFHYNQKKNEQTKKANQCGPGVFFVLLLIVAAAVIIVWALLFPMESRDITSDASQPTYQCYGDKMGYWRSAVLIYHGVMLVLALIIVWAALVQVPPGRPSGETKLLTFMVYFVAFVCIIPGLVIYYLLNPPSRVATIHYAVNGGLTLLATLMTLLLLVISKSLTSGRRSSYDKQKNSSDLEMHDRGDLDSAETAPASAMKDSGKKNKKNKNHVVGFTTDVYGADQHDQDSETKSPSDVHYSLEHTQTGYANIVEYADNTENEAKDVDGGISEHAMHAEETIGSDDLMTDYKDEAYNSEDRPYANLDAGSTCSSEERRSSDVEGNPAFGINPDYSEEMALGATAADFAQESSEDDDVASLPQHEGENNSNPDLPYTVENRPPTPLPKRTSLPSSFAGSEDN